MTTGAPRSPGTDPRHPTTGHQARAVCPCGWVATRWSATDTDAALEVARALAEHASRSHPPHRLTGWWRRTGLSPRAHRRFVGPTSHAGDGFRCAVACSCGWVRECRSAERATLLSGAEREHRRHVTVETGRTPRRDYVVLALMLVALAALATLLVRTVIDLSS